MQDLFKVKPAFTFSWDSPSQTKNRYSYVSISQLQNTIYISYSNFNAILAFDLHGNHRYSIIINIPKFILGKFCSLSENLFCVCDIRSNRRVHLITREGFIITSLVYVHDALRRYSRSSSIVECISAEHLNVFYIANECHVYSYGKEGNFQITVERELNYYYRGIQAVSIKDDDLNLVIRSSYSWYIYYAQENRIEKLQIPISGFNKFVVLQDYILCFDNQIAPCLAIGRLGSEHVSYVKARIWIIHPRKNCHTICLHTASRIVYILNKDNNVIAFNLDDLLELYQGAQRNTLGNIENDEESDLFDTLYN